MIRTVIIVFASPTLTQKAKKLLYSNSIGSDITKISSESGCSFALAVAESNKNTAVQILKKHVIPFRIGN